jgi:hypothetical protein
LVETWENENQMVGHLHVDIIRDSESQIDGDSSLFFSKTIDTAIMTLNKGDIYCTSDFELEVNYKRYNAKADKLFLVCILTNPHCDDQELVRSFVNDGFSEQHSI